MDAAGPTNGSSGTLATTTPAIPPFNTDKLIEYAKEVLAVTLGADKDELTEPGCLFSDELVDDTTAKLSRYAQESIVAVYVIKNLKEQEHGVLEGQAELFTRNPRCSGLTGVSEADSESSNLSHTYTLSFELQSTPTTVASVAFIKRPGPLDNSVKLFLQLQVINLPGHASLIGTQGAISPYEILHAMVHSAIAPYFEAHTKEKESRALTRTNRFTDADAKTGELW